MTDILFKAKKKTNGEWIEGYFVKVKWYLDGSTKFVIFPTDVCMYPHCEVSEWEEVIPETICRTTGFKDKNGNPIWENDIVNKVDTNALGYHRERICNVSFDEYGYWKITTLYGDGYWMGEFENEQFEVIGNIFDNPELAEKFEQNEDGE